MTLAKLAKALVTVTHQENPPLRWGRRSRRDRNRREDGQDLLAQVDAYRQLSSNLAHDDA